jgi:hypothetical protein
VWHGGPHGTVRVQIKGRLAALIAGGEELYPNEVWGKVERVMLIHIGAGCEVTVVDYRQHPGIRHRVVGFHWIRTAATLGDESSPRIELPHSLLLLLAGPNALLFSRSRIRLCLLFSGEFTGL